MDNQINQKDQKGLRGWLRRHKPSKRRLIQVYAALLYNANLKGFATGKIFTGNTKNLCVPGLNCYSCPGAVGACPLGSLQNALASSKTSSLAYVFGIFVLLGLLLGRTICGFLCPFGLIQELLHKIPSPKLKKSRATRVLSYFKYVILVAMVILIPLAFSDKLAVPGFCKYICPDGTLIGALSLLIHPDNADMFGMLGPLFTWKFCLLVVFLVASVFIFRFFCRFFCPLGAIYGFFCRVAMLGVKLDRQTCIQCGLCVTTCKMDIRHVGDHECIHCGDCIPVCPTNAIHRSGSRYFIADPTAAIGGDTTSAPAEPEAADAQARKLTRRRKVCQITAAVLAVAVLGGAIWYYNFRKDDSTVTELPQEYGYEVGNFCPDFTVPEAGKDETFTLSEHRDSIVIVNFWASWCGPCKKELPEFEQLAKDFAGQVEVLAISTDATEKSQASALAYIRENGFSAIRFAFDASDACMGGTVFDAIGRSDSLPVTIVLDQEGKIIFRHVGSADYETLLAAIAPAMMS